MPAVAEADFYRCRRPDGSAVVTNHIPKGMAKRCRLIMKTAPTRKEEAASDDSSSSRSSSRTRRSDPRPSTRSSSSSSSRLATPTGLPEGSLWRTILEAASRYDLPPAFVLAVIRIESNFHPRAVSRVGAQGLMQLMPATAESLGVTDPFDIRQNVMGGCKFLRMLANRHEGDLPRTIASYHAGPGAVDAKEGVPYAQTEEYVRMVLDKYYEYKELLKERGI